MPKVQIGEHTVALRDRLPLRTHANVVKLLADVTTHDLKTAIPLAQAVIESWDFEGSPQDDAAYEEMDAGDAYRLFKAIEADLERRMLGEPKNSGGASSSPSPSTATT
jgi:hypothetical protein